MKQDEFPIYLDHNASTPVLPEVLDAMLPWLRDHFGNPSSTHVYGRTMHAAVEEARGRVAGLIACEPDELFFTSGGTESNNLAIFGVTSATPGRRQLVTSDNSGRVLASVVQEALSEETVLVTIMHANSETGTLQPIREIAESAHRAGALMHSDAAQSCGKVKISVDFEQVDLLSIAGHKLYAPQGVGALYVRAGTPISPVLIGAGHERGLRPGTENVASVVGLGKACEIAQDSLEQEGRRLSSLRDRLWHRLLENIPGLALNGHPDKRLPNTLNVLFPGVSGNALLTACPGIAASTGSACHEAGDSASAVILAMGVPEQEAVGSVRLTLGRGNREDEIEQAAMSLVKAWKGLI